MLFTAFYRSPAGLLRLTGDDSSVTSVSFEKKICDEPENTSPVLERCKKELDEYFSGTLTEFTLPLNPTGTEFQRRVWNLLREIPFGTVISYRELAIRAGNIKTIRAVGRANGANPIGILIPCHRVIGTNGALTGYAGGLEKKRWLLMHEAAISNHDYGLFSLAGEKTTA